MRTQGQCKGCWRLGVQGTVEPAWALGVVGLKAATVFQKAWASARTCHPSARVVAQEIAGRLAAK
ncbi:MAG: hypothetical protein WCL11_27265 [Verrucomicrobiota bacterium]